MSAAQFKLNYDASKFDYVSASAGTYNAGTKTYVYLNYEDVAALGSVTFTFKSKATGNGAFSISGVVLSTNATIASSSTTVTVEAPKSNTTSTNTNKNTTIKKNNTTNTNKNNEEENKEPEVIEKSELDTFKREVANLVETDYTEESWKALQDAIAKAEAAANNDEYNSVKGDLNLSKLVPVEFSKDELNKVLRALIGKVEKDYTEESWEELQDAIDAAELATLKSEYDAVKEKLTINGLILKEKGPLEGVIEMLDEMGPLPLILISIIIVLLIMVIALFVMYKNMKNRTSVIGKRFE